MAAAMDKPIALDRHGGSGSVRNTVPLAVRVT